MTEAEHWFTIFEYLVVPDIKNQATLRGLDPTKLTFENILHHGQAALVVSYGVIPVYLIYYRDTQLYGVTDDLYYLHRPEGIIFLVDAVDRVVTMLEWKLNQQETSQDAT